VLHAIITPATIPAKESVVIVDAVLVHTGVHLEYALVVILYAETATLIQAARNASRMRVVYQIVPAMMDSGSM
jgi:hypothetical protein